jgi:choline dehydrogenase-like flavoprotein
MTLRHVNAVVVGAGAGGGIVAKELSEAGLSVVLLERGDWIGFNHHDHDELINQRTSVLATGFGPDDRHPRVAEMRPGEWRVVSPRDGSYGNNAACVGSGTVSYGAMAWRFMEEDFRLRSIYGALEGSTLEDWPISYADLEPCYDRAEWEIGVAGDMSANPFSPPRAGRTRCRRSRTTARAVCSRRRPGGWAGILSPSRCCATPCPTAAATPASVAVTAWALPARSTPRTARRTPSSPPPSPRAIANCAPTRS